MDGTCFRYTHPSLSLIILFNPLDDTGEYTRKAFNPLQCDGRDKSYYTLNAKYTLNFGF
jgi:hypothetical protein